MGRNSRSLIAKDNMEQLMKMAEKGDLNMPDIQEGAGEDEKAAKVTEPLVKSEDKSTASSADKVEEKVETEEEKKRRERAEARAKKIEAIAARRNAGLNPLDDDASAVSGISKRRDRLRRKKKKDQALAAMEETKSVNDDSVKSDAVSHKSDKSSVKVETEEDKKRRERPRLVLKSLTEWLREEMLVLQKMMMIQLSLAFQNATAFEGKRVPWQQSPPSKTNGMSGSVISLPLY